MWVQHVKQHVLAVKKILKEIEILSKYTGFSYVYFKEQPTNF